MRVLCCLDGTNVEQVSRATQMLATSRPPTLAILYVTDTGPRHDIEHLRERFLRPPAPPPPREEEIRQAEKTSAQAILNEGLRYLLADGTLPKERQTERQTVYTAAEWPAELGIDLARGVYGRE